MLPLIGRIAALVVGSLGSLGVGYLFGRSEKLKIREWKSRAEERRNAKRDKNLDKKVRRAKAREKGLIKREQKIVEREKSVFLREEQARLKASKAESEASAAEKRACEAEKKAATERKRAKAAEERTIKAEDKVREAKKIARDAQERTRVAHANTREAYQKVQQAQDRAAEAERELYKVKQSEKEALKRASAAEKLQLELRAEAENTKKFATDELARRRTEEAEANRQRAELEDWKAEILRLEKEGSYIRKVGNGICLTQSISLCGTQEIIELYDFPDELLNNRRNCKAHHNLLNYLRHERTNYDDIRESLRFGDVSAYRHLRHVVDELILEELRRRGYEPDPIWEK